MIERYTIDAMLVQWGDRLFYPGNRIVKSDGAPRLSGVLLRRRAEAVRARLEGTLVRRAPQVMVKVTGGGRGMRAIAAHFRYISKNGRLEMEDERGERLQGKRDLPGLVDEWRLGGTPIGEEGGRREAFNVMLSMPRGVDPGCVLLAARQFARCAFAGHKYVMVLHDHRANPHVHLSVRAESELGQRLNPRKADLRRWRARFAEDLRGLGVDAEASPRTWRGAPRRGEALWRIKAKDAGRLRRSEGAKVSLQERPRVVTVDGLRAVTDLLSRSGSGADRVLGQRIAAATQGQWLDRKTSHSTQTREGPLPRDVDPGR